MFPKRAETFIVFLFPQDRSSVAETPTEAVGFLKVIQKVLDMARLSLGMTSTFLPADSRDSSLWALC